MISKTSKFFFNLGIINRIRSVLPLPDAPINNTFFLFLKKEKLFEHLHSQHMPFGFKLGVESLCVENDDRTFIDLVSLADSLVIDNSKCVVLTHFIG